MLTLLIPMLLLLLPNTFFSSKLWMTPMLIMMTTAFYSLVFIHQPFLDPVLLNPLFSYDLMSIILIILSFWISTFMILSSLNIYPQLNYNKFNFTINILLMILILAFSVSNFFTFYIMFESSLIPTLLLILTWGYQPERLQAGKYLMLYTISSSLPLMLSLTYLYKLNGSLAMNMYMLYLPPFHPPLNQLWWFICILAFLVKLPMYFTHLWLPKAHVEAPIAGSMILAGLLLKLGGYGLLRMAQLAPHLMFSSYPFLSSIALYGGVITSLICLRQNDMKSLIAYSSIGHMSLIIMGVTMMTMWGWQSTFTMMISHGLCSSAMFLLANFTYNSTKTRSIFLTKGILRLSPLLTLWWFLLLIMNSSAPPTTNLLAEIGFFISSLWASPIIMMLIGTMSFLALVYSLYLYISINHGYGNLTLNPMLLTPPILMHTLFFFHFIPNLLFILKPEIILLTF